MTRRNAMLAAAVLFGLTPSALAQGWTPDRPIRLVIPFAVGGTTDILGRIVAERLGAALGQPVVVENRAGAGGNIGVETVIRAAPDGHTLIFAIVGQLAFNPHLQRLPYDALRELAPIGMIFTSELVALVPAASPHRTLGDLLADARARPGGLNYASAGNGSGSHLFTEAFRRAADLDIVHVPYRGAGPALSDLVAGRVDFMLDAMPSAIGHVHSGGLRALATTGAQRNPHMRELPTMQEAGLPGYTAVAWGGLMAPTATPPGIVARLSQALREVLAEPAMRERFLALGAATEISTPAEMERLAIAEFARWGEVIRVSGIRAE